MSKKQLKTLAEIEPLIGSVVDYNGGSVTVLAVSDLDCDEWVLGWVTVQYEIIRLPSGQTEDYIESLPIYGWNGPIDGPPESGEYTFWTQDDAST